MPYIINKTSGAKLAVVQDGTTDSNTLPITLLGRNFAGYGEPVNENFVKILENFANRLPPAKAMIGQLWYDTNSKRLRLNTGVGVDTWKSLGIVEYSNTKPVGYNAGDMWYKPDSGQLYAYSGIGTNWNLIGPIDTKAADNGAFSDSVLNFNTGLSEPVVKLRVKGVETGIISSTKFTVQPIDPSYGSYKNLVRGINLPNVTTKGVSYDPSSDIGLLFWGTAGSALGVVTGNGSYIAADDLVVRANVMSFSSLDIGDDGLRIGDHSIFKIHVTDSNTGNLTVLNDPNLAKLNINIGATGTNVLSIHTATSGTYVISPSVTGNPVYLGTETNKFAYAGIDTISANVVRSSEVYDGNKRVVTTLLVNTSGGIGGTISTVGTTATLVLSNLGVKSLTGTANRITVNGGIAQTTGNITLSLPQDIHTGATVTFNRINGTQVYDSNARVLTTATIGSVITAYNFVPRSSVGVANGVAGLDSTGKVPAAQLPETVAVNDTLTSTSPTQALSANQGRQLSEWLDVALYAPIAWPSSVAPPGFVTMMGQAIQSSMYPKLFALYGSTLPDMRGEFIRGWDAGRGADPGRTIRSWQAGQVQKHKHLSFGEATNGWVFGNSPTRGYMGTRGGIDYDNYFYYTNDGTPYGSADPNLGVVGEETRPRNIAFNYIVKLG